MILFFIIFCIYLLHIHFLIQNIFFGLDEIVFFGHSISYQFDVSIAQVSLLYSTLCLAAFVVGYQIFYRRRSKSLTPVPLSVDISGCRNEIRWLNFFGIVVTLYMVIVIAMTGGVYSSMTVIRASSGFILELRMFYLLLLTHVMLNVPLNQFLSDRAFRIPRLVLLAYVVAVVLFQARSNLFEVATVLVIPWLIWNGDKIKFKYLVFLFFGMFIPNIIILGRIGLEGDFWSIVDQVFSFEYTMLLSKFLGAAIAYPVPMDSLSFVPQLRLLLPSPLRDLFDFAPISYEFFDLLSLDAGVTGGGFSLLAQLYNDFRWFAPIVLLLLGCLIGRAIGQGRFSGRVSIRSSVGPLLYGGFLMAVRNDFGVLLKYSIQLFIVAFVLSYIVKTRLGKTNKLIPSQVIKTL